MKRTQRFAKNDGNGGEEKVDGWTVEPSVGEPEELPSRGFEKTERETKRGKTKRTNG